MLPGPIRKGLPQLFANAGMSVVKATTVAGSPSRAPSRTAGMKRISFASQSGCAAAATCWRSSDTSPTTRIKISAWASSGMMFGARPPLIKPIFNVCWTQHFVHWKRNCSQAGQAIQQFQNRRVTQLRIGGVSHSSVGKNVEPESAFRSERQLVLGRLAVN